MKECLKPSRAHSLVGKQDGHMEHELKQNTIQAESKQEHRQAAPW